MKRAFCWASCLVMSFGLSLSGDPRSAFIWTAAAFVILAMDDLAKEKKP